MEWRDLLGILATVIALVSYIPYLYTIVKGTTRPHGFSWFVFGILTVIYQSGVVDLDAFMNWLLPGGRY